MSEYAMLPETSEDYYLVVDRAELCARAEELGYGNVITLPADNPHDGIVEAIRDSGKAVAAVYYGLDLDGCEFDGPASRCSELLSRLYDAGVPRMGVNIADEMFVDFDVYPPSVADALTQFPSREKLKNWLIGRGLILSSDYTDRCGNCQSHLEPGDRYCRACGTERGEGAFQPYRNVTNIVYGPPCKAKFKCPDCGNIWIDITIGTIGRSSFCPQCGCGDIRTIDDKVLGFGNWYNATGEPFDEDERPVLLTDRQVLSLLSQRDGKEAWGSGLLKRLRAADVPMPTRTHTRGDGSEPEEEPHPRTEAEGETLTLASHILALSGSNPDRDAPACPICGSPYVADIGYEIQGRHFDTLAKGVHARTRTGDVLVTTDIYGCLKKGDEAGSSRRTAYLCLKCGSEYGEYDFSREVARAKDVGEGSHGGKDGAAAARAAKTARGTVSALGGGIASLGGRIGSRLRERDVKADGKADDAPCDVDGASS